MKPKNAEKKWQRTSVTNLLRNGQSGKYYARVKVNGKQKWKTLNTAVFSVAKLRLAEGEKNMRVQGAAAKGEPVDEAISEGRQAVSRQHAEDDQGARKRWS